MRSASHRADFLIRIPADPKSRELVELDAALGAFGAKALQIHAKATAAIVACATGIFGFGCIQALLHGVQP
jgi:hypothetical protein